MLLNRCACGTVVFMISVTLAPALEPLIPNDPQFSEQWGLLNTGQTVDGVSGEDGADVRAPQAWAVHRGTSAIVVAIVGTGVDPHPEFADRLLEGCATVGDPYDSRDRYPSGPLGTHVAGVIGAATDNGAGIAGLNGEVHLLPVHVIETATANERPVAEGIVWAVDQGADIIVVPLQYYGGGSQELADAVAYAFIRDVLVIAPTGKQGSNTIAFPAAFEGCLAVAATTNRDERATFSNYGPQVDVAAPGWNIVSTWRDGGYANLEVASISAAGFAAGVAALVLSYAPQLSPVEAGEILISSADDLGDPYYFGAGRINAERALDLAPAPALRFEHVEPLPTTIPPGRPTSLIVRIASVAQTLEPGSARVTHRRPPGGFTSHPLTPLGDDLFAVELPGTPCEETLEFFLMARGDGGALVFDPPDFDPADPLENLHSAHAVTWESLFDDDFEDDLEWTAIEEGDDTKGDWSG